MCHRWNGLCGLLLLGLPSAPVVAQEPLIVNVWPGAVPGEARAAGPEEWVEPRPGQRIVQRLTNVSEPTLSIYRPSAAIDTGAAVLIAPGGGYHILAWDLEGTEVAEWLNSIGVTGIVLKYRVPRRPGEPGDEPPLGPRQDAQRALSLVRSRADEWGLDPERIGMLGFSAGGHLTAATAVGFDRRSYEPIDEIDQVSCRPDFAVLVYPAYLIDKETKELRDSMTVTNNTPPCFFAHAIDDRVDAENSVQMFTALKRAGVNGELHIYSTGGHGFGLRPSDDACSTWPARCAEWLKASGFLEQRD